MFTGAQKLVAKIKEYNPKIAVFNGKGIYEVFSGQKEFIFGKQPDKITDTETVRYVIGAILTRIRTGSVFILTQIRIQQIRIS